VNIVADESEPIKASERCERRESGIKIPQPNQPEESKEQKDLQIFTILNMVWPGFLGGFAILSYDSKP
jgi:hypothetical protein